jgi:hypothetical protein
MKRAKMMTARMAMMMETRLLKTNRSLSTPLLSLA